MSITQIEIGSPTTNFGVTVLRISDGRNTIELAGVVELEIVLRAAQIAIGRDREHHIGAIENEDVLFVIEELPPRPLHKKRPTRRRKTTKTTV